MTRFHLKIARAKFSFSFAPLLLAGAGIAALLLLLAYVDALHSSMRQGEAFRQSQRLSDAGAVGLKASTSPPGGTQRAVVLVPK